MVQPVDRARLCALLLDAIDRRARVLPQELDPRFLGARIVFGRLDEIHEPHERPLKPITELLVRDAAVSVPSNIAEEIRKKNRAEAEAVGGRK